MMELRGRISTATSKKHFLLMHLSHAGGKSVRLRAMVDSDHAADKETRWSQTGFLIFLNLALITWFSKKQMTVESSVLELNLSR